LQAVHTAGIIHRDIKPANIFMGDELKIGDFGIALYSSTVKKVEEE
jgi:serine/threonine protein kinase